MAKDKFCAVCSSSFEPRCNAQKYCLSCRDKVSKAQNREYNRKRGYQRKYRSRPDVKARKREYMRKYYALHAEELKTKGREYYALHTEELKTKNREYQRKWYTHPDVKAKIQERSRKNQRKLQSLRKKRKEFLLNNPDELDKLRKKFMEELKSEQERNTGNNQE